MQGQSIVTYDKERGFSAFFEIQAKAVNGIFSRSRFENKYFAFDLHAGCGFNERVKVSGSPILTIDAFENANVPFVLHASEIDKTTAIKLAAATRHVSDVHVVYGDCREMVEMIPEIIKAYGEKPQFAYGHILIDPNRPADIPCDEIQVVTRICPKLDIAFNFPGNAMKRIKAGHGIDNRFFIDIDDVPDLLGKKYVLIRMPFASDGWHFALIVGRNFPFRDHKKLRLHEWDSDEGREARRKIRFTKAEKRANGNGRLF